MILDNELEVSADPDVVFSLINDVARVASCLPGAVLDGEEDGAYLGRIKLKVGPINAAYSGKVRFTEVVPAERRIRISARGADTHGSGDAEADVALSVIETATGSSLRLHTDLVIRGKIAQFGKGVIVTVSNRLLEQFARNLRAELDSDQTVPAGASAGVVTPRAPASNVASGAVQSDDALDGLGMLLPENAGRYAATAGAVAVAFFQGWLLGRVRTQDKLIKELSRAR